SPEVLYNVSTDPPEREDHRGGDGIRTRVYGFAGRCLASRPLHRHEARSTTGASTRHGMSPPSGRRDWNPRPSPWQGDALPTEPRPRATFRPGPAPCASQTLTERRDGRPTGSRADDLRRVRN